MRSVHGRNGGSEGERVRYTRREGTYTNENRTRPESKFGSRPDWYFEFRVSWITPEPVRRRGRAAAGRRTTTAVESSGHRPGTARRSWPASSRGRTPAR